MTVLSWTSKPETKTTAAPSPETPAESGFHITSEDAANWYLRKLANLEAEKKRVLTQAELIVKQLDADAEGLRHLYEGELQEFVRQRLASNGNRRKSVAFLQGTCAFRTVAASVKIADAQAALDYARQNAPEAVRTQEVLDTAKYRERAETALQNGETLPGVEVVAERESFSVRFGKTSG